MFDPNIADAYIGLEETSDGGMTNAITFLVSPGQLTTNHADAADNGMYLPVTLTREELREHLANLDEDWADHEEFALGIPAA